MNPQTELEEIVIGSILIEPNSAFTALSILRPYMVREPRLKQIYEAINNLYVQKKPVDIPLVCAELKKMNVLESIGGTYFVVSTTNRTAGSQHIETHCRKLVELWLKEQLSIVAKRIAYKADDPTEDAFECIEYGLKEIQNLLSDIGGNEGQNIETIKNELIDNLEECLTKGIQSGVPIRIEKLNTHTNGWQKSDLIILAARPGMGKTASAIEFALYPALNDTPVAVFSLEMSKSQLASRILSNITSMPLQKIITKKANKYDIDLLRKDGQILDGVPLYIDDTPALRILDLQNRARKLKREKNIELIIIDYLQLMRGTGTGNRESEVSEISRGLKALAKELDIPVIALSQLSRKVEERQNKTPQLSDLRESGAIEQDADMVIFPFRPEVYSDEQYEIDTNQFVSPHGLIMFIIAKYRNGSPGDFPARWIGEITRIENYEY